MDYEKILEEQMNNVVDPEQTGRISENAGRITEMYHGKAGGSNGI